MRVTFVWPFWQAPAKYDELRWSIRSVYQNFVEPNCEIDTVVVGDQPIIRRHKVSWYGGRTIHVPRLVRGSGRAGVEDQCGKFLRALQDPGTAETVVWMMDDVYFIKPVTLADLRQPRHLGVITKEKLAAGVSSGWWQAARYDTAKVLIEGGFPAYGFATHLPHVVDRDKAIKLITDYDVPKRRLLWEMLYENIHLETTPVSATPFLRIISDSKCLLSTRSATARASVMVSAGNSWNEDHRAFLFETFPNPSPVEVDPPIPVLVSKLKSRHAYKPPQAVPPVPVVEEQPLEVPVVHSSRPKITAVLNCYGRPDNFPCQVNAMKKQTVPCELLVWQNAHEPTKSQWHRDWFDPNQMTYGGCSHNLGVWARFAFALNANTEFVCIFDDDAVPGAEWFANCLETFQKYPGLLGGNGVVFHSLTDYNARTNFGWAYPNRYATQVDIVGHAWFMRREWLGLYWASMPPLDSCPTAGEDFHASFALQKHGINTFVPQHRKNQKRRWCNESQKAGFRRGRSGPAISKDPVLAKKVQAQLKRYVGMGFRLLEHDKISQFAV